ncbi:unnamed protein product [Ostreobium quekettii]|uniref:Transcription initiation factor TFIID subunit 13 n=1 Tax=Ostreobium quekettii TaxID=121088 RepID=A0A8S1ISI1_9CHLO|nr:unnamed protein product [Ostreobium quekettii]|eukprot:evm.model.scf_59.7 EVM.evm.TU.scf_59.7   scf_59:46526-49151(+)
MKAVAQQQPGASSRPPEQVRGGEAGWATTGAPAGPSGRNAGGGTGTPDAPRKRVRPSSNTTDGESDGPVKRGLFEKDLPGIMYGYGDSETPRQETVELVEDIVFEYVSGLLHKAMETASLRGKLKYEDFMFQVRSEPQKIERIQELLQKNEEIKKARKQMDLDNAD